MQFFNLIILTSFLVAAYPSIDRATCSMSQVTMLEGAIPEMGWIVENAIECTEGLKNLSPSNCFDIVTRQTLQAYFGAPESRADVVFSKKIFKPP